MKKSFIVFDFDGTMVNTNDVITASWMATFEHYLGYRPERREIEATFGETLKDTVANYFPNETFEEVRDYYRAYQDAHQEGMVYVFSGVEDLLRELRTRGCKIGVATSRTSYSFWNYMRQFGIEDTVDEVVTMEDVTAHKPAPDSMYCIMDKLGAKPEETLMIGDTKYDIGCAANAGVESVLVGWSHYVDEDALESSGFIPNYRIDKPEEILELI